MLDLSALADVQIALERAGDDLIVRFPDGSVVIVEGFYLDGLPVAEEIVLGDGASMPPSEFDVALGVSVVPLAEGEDPRGNGAGNTAFSYSSVNALDLVPDSEPGGGTPFGVRFSSDPSDPLFASSLAGNLAPIARDGSTETTEDETVAFDILSVASDPTGDNLTVTEVVQVSGRPLQAVLSGGVVTFDPIPDFQDLAVGEEAVAVFRYTVTDGLAARSGQIEVTIKGLNDGPFVSAQTDVSETLAETNAGLATTGSFEVTDVDVTDVVSITGVTVATSGDDGAAPGSAALLAMFSPQTGVEIDGSSTTGVVDWTFDSGSEAFDYLAVNESLTLTYTVTLADDDTPPLSVTQDVTITITGTNDAPVLESFAQGFEADAQGLRDGSSGWYGQVTRAASGTDGIVSAEGSHHAVIEQGFFDGQTSGAESGAFTRFDGYRSEWLGEWSAEVQVYLDTGWSAGEGFDYSVASNNAAGVHLRDFIFHVTKDSSTGDLLLGASNNTNFDPREDLETLPNFAVIGQSGWHTLQHRFYEDGGVLAVEMRVLDGAGAVVFSQVLSNPGDLIGNVGGNRYGWFTNIDIAGGIAVDGLKLTTPPQSELALTEDRRRSDGERPADRDGCGSQRRGDGERDRSERERRSDRAGLHPGAAGGDAERDDAWPDRRGSGRCGQSGLELRQRRGGLRLSGRRAKPDPRLHHHRRRQPRRHRRADPLRNHLRHQ